MGKPIRFNVAQWMEAFEYYYNLYRVGRGSYRKTAKAIGVNEGTITRWAKGNLEQNLLPWDQLIEIRLKDVRELCHEKVVEKEVNIYTTITNFLKQEVDKYIDDIKSSSGIAIKSISDLQKAVSIIEKVQGLSNLEKHNTETEQMINSINNVVLDENKTQEEITTIEAKLNQLIFKIERTGKKQKEIIKNKNVTRNE